MFSARTAPVSPVSYLCIDGSGEDVLDVSQQFVCFHQVCSWGVLKGQVALHRVRESHTQVKVGHRTHKWKILSLEFRMNENS